MASLPALPANDRLAPIVAFFWDRPSHIALYSQFALRVALATWFHESGGGGGGGEATVAPVMEGWEWG